MVDCINSHVGANRGEVYDKRYQAGTEKFYWKYFEMPLVVKIFGKLNRNNSIRYLDFAVGTGRILEIAAQEFTDIVGVDVSADMLNEAKKKALSAKLLLANVTTDTLDVGEFDIISCFRFILNAEPELREKVLLWIRGVVAQNGVFIVNNHLNSASVTGLVCRLSNFLRRKKIHNTLSDAEVKSLLLRCGFQIEERHSFGFIPAWRNRLWLPHDLLHVFEKMIGKIFFLRRFAKDCIYVCSPIL